MFVRYSIVALAIVSLVNSGAVPITKCKADDSKCMKDNTKVLVPLFAAGVPELGIETLDPVFFKKIDSSTNTLKLVFSDTTVTGLSSCKFKKISRDAVKMMLSARIHCRVIVDGTYNMSGALFLLPINGNGKVHIEHETIEINFDLAYKEEKGADGKTHWTTGSWKHDFKYIGKTKMEFDNLFDGNELLGRAARDLMKTSANEIATETAAPVVKTITGRILKNVKIFFEKVPVEDFVEE